MTELLTAAQMRAIEQAAIASGEVTGLELMERAGAGVLNAILQEWPDMAKSPQKAVVLCGPGNNGGDGFVVARLLKARGWDVEVFLYGEVEKLPPDAKVNAKRWMEMGAVLDITIIANTFTFSNAKSARKGTDVIVDALFGTGITRPIEGLDIMIDDVKLRAEYFDKSHEFTRVVSIDFPSGISSDTGNEIEPSAPLLDDSIVSNLTVTFHCLKIGHTIGVGPTACGEIVVKEIGLKKHGCVGVRLVTSKSIRIPKHSMSHKFHYGHALILSGPATRTGAARLAARGALRIGAGVVSLGCPQEAAAECAAQLTAIMLAPIEDGAALKATLQDKRINALCLGPALGVDDRGRGLLEAAVRAEHAPYVVLDADALTILAKVPELFAKLHKNCVLTPHAGEFKRLFPDIAAKLEAPAATGPAYSKVDATREAAARAGCVVLFKGADTVIAAPDGRAAINSAHYDRAAPWLATAGSGDVLAGFITGLLARGFAPMQAAETAAWLHVECALKFGPGLIAEDIPEQLPAVFLELDL